MASLLKSSSEALQKGLPFRELVMFYSDVLIEDNNLHKRFDKFIRSTIKLILIGNLLANDATAEVNFIM